MHGLFGGDVANLLSTYGYLAVAVAVGLESMGLPVPGETVLISAAIYSGTTHGLDIVGVIAAAVAGAAIGDSIGYWLGRELGFRLLRRFGPRVGLGPERLKLGRYLFHRHGGKVVFFGRFVAILRALAAFLAGANGMAWPRFLVYNVAGGVLWATLFGTGAWLLGDAVHRLTGPFAIAVTSAAVVALVVATVLLRRNEQRLIAEAERAEPGPLPAEGD
jgi:membrane protein DedA with SNARE-associated domain